ncbi:MAG TPA: cytochrome C oxidase subunit IV family protein [Tepidisphaeraceae bacterium]|jgi:cytochrome c oxidase subunit 4
MAHETQHAHSPHRTYLLVFAALIVLLALTVVAAHFNFGTWSLIIAMLIAATKAVLVVLFFMHVWGSTRLTWLFAAAAFFWLGIMITLTFSDYVTRTAVPAALKQGPGGTEGIVKLEKMP